MGSLSHSMRECSRTLVQQKHQGSAQIQFRPLTRAAKVEIEPNVLQLVYLTAAPAAEQARKGKTKKQREPASPPAMTQASLLGDKLANLSGSSRALIPGDSPDVRVIPLSALKEEVRTNGSSVLCDLMRPRKKVRLGKWVNVKLWQDLVLNPSVALTPPGRELAGPQVREHVHEILLAVSWFRWSQAWR